LLHVLYPIAVKYGVSLPNVATRWVLQQPAVGAVIVGTRLGISCHRSENLKVFDFALDADDLRAIDKLALGQDSEKSMAVFQKLGDCGNEYHIMR
jgi:aryl-alcohol dehydrogenase-like predicted oxidoreductase